MTHYLFIDYDKGTSGVLLTGKTKEIRNRLAALINPVRNTPNSYLKKEYLCIVDGTKSNNEFQKEEIEISRPLKNKYAKSIFQLIQQKNGFGIFLVQISTGRTHQIRIHSQETIAEGSIVGDYTYGNSATKYGLESGRFLLHAYRKSICKEGENDIIIKGDIPDDMLHFIEKRMKVKNTNFLANI